MIIGFYKKFDKEYKKLSQKEKKEIQKIYFFTDEFNQFQITILFMENMMDGYRSINISGDIRAIFKINLGNIEFTIIGNHNNLYK